MHAHRISQIAQVGAARWNALFPEGHPFSRYEFLHALERSGSVGADRGWEVAHLLLEDARGELRGAAPCYIKSHSWGEFVFDWSWAQASQQLGVAYYPKSLCAAPFTPVRGPRLGAHDTATRQALASALYDTATELGHSSAHLLFLGEDDRQAAEAAGYLLRQDLRYHWHNRDFEDFDAFLAALNSERRKKIRRERRRVREAGIAFETRPGDSLDDATWARIYALYASTYHVRGQAPYLSEAFWQEYGRFPGTPVRVTLARHNGRIIACALFVEGADTLYGRHWGSEADYHSLHFETCYYQGIDYCIKKGLKHFDAGVQGGHKILRGFDPIITSSAHRIKDPRLHQAVAHFLRREREAIAQGRQQLDEHTAWRKATAPPAAGALK